jgi:nitrogen regulatory protein PII
MARIPHPTYDRILERLGITEVDVARVMGYGGQRPAHSMRTSSRYKSGNLQADFVRMYEFLKTRLEL